MTLFSCVVLLEIYWYKPILLSIACFCTEFSYDRRNYFTIIKTTTSFFFFQTSDCTEESRKDETCLQFKMNKDFIKTRKIISQNSVEWSKFHTFWLWKTAYDVQFLVIFFWERNFCLYFIGKIYLFPFFLSVSRRK